MVTERIQLIQQDKGMYRDSRDRVPVGRDKIYEIINLIEYIIINTEGTFKP